METNGAEIPLENFYGFTEEWIRRGTYYYCTSPLMHGDEKATFKGFRVPFNYNGCLLYTSYGKRRRKGLNLCSTETKCKKM